MLDADWFSADEYKAVFLIKPRPQHNTVSIAEMTSFIAQYCQYYQNDVIVGAPVLC